MSDVVCEMLCVGCCVSEGSQSAAPATKSAHQAPVPSRRQGVHPTPWQAASAAHSTQMLPAERRCPADARAYIRPLGKQQAPHTARKCHRQSAGAQPTPGRTSDPLASSKRRTQHAKAIPAERRCPSDARAYIRPLGKQLQSRQFAASSSTNAVPATKSAHGGSHSAAPATKSAHGGSQSAAPATKSAHGGSQSAAPATKSAPRGSHSAAPATKSAHGGSLSAVPAPKSARGGSHSAVPATKSAHGGSQSAVPATRSAHGGSQSTAPATKSAHEGSQSAAPATKPAHQAPVPSRRQGVHPTPWQAASAAHSTQMLPAERRCPADARAYIRPLGKQQAPHTARKCHQQSAGAQPTPGRTSDPLQAASAAHSTQMLPPSAGAQPTPGRTSDPLASSKRRTQHAKATGRAPVPSRRQGVHWTRTQRAKAIPAERRRPADARAYIRPLGKQQAPHTARKCHRQSAGAQPTPGRTSDPLASSKRRTRRANATGRAPAPSRRQGVHPTPWQAASAARSAQRLPAERRCPADARAYIRPLGKQQVPHTARKGYRPSAGAQPTLGRTQMLPAERRRPADARAYIGPLGKQQAPHTARKCYV